MKKKTVLSDHVRKKKKLIPPLLAVMGGKHAPYSWTKELAPQFLWIASLHEYLGLRRGTACAAAFIDALSHLIPEKDRPLFATISSFSELSRKQKNEALHILHEKGYLTDLQNGLEPLLSTLPKSPLSFFKKKSICSQKQAVISLNKILPELYDRYSKRSAHVHATALYLSAIQGKLKFSAGSSLDNLNAISDYPDTDESKIVASSLRAMISMFVFEEEKDARKKSADDYNFYFWSKISKIGQCSVEEIDYLKKKPKDQLGQIVFSFINNSRKELELRIKKWGFDLNGNEFYEVVGALMARQVTLCNELASAPPVWTAHSAPIFLRAMADVYITISWIFKDPQKRSLQFIEDGIGSVKLELAHRKAELEKCNSEEKQQLERFVEFLEYWISSQRIESLVEVNLGNWSGISTRKMAEEAGCLDFYNYVYQSFSAAVHSNWFHLSTKNLQFCENPAHRNHKRPFILDAPIDTHYLYLAAKYLQKTFDEFDKRTKIYVKGRSAFNILCKDLYG